MSSACTGNPGLPSAVPDPGTVPGIPASVYRGICRYLGYRNIVPDDAVRERIRRNYRALEDASDRRSVFRTFPVSFPAEGTVRIGFSSSADGFTVESRDLHRNLKGCSEVILLAVTIGPGPDMLVRRAGVSGMLDAAILQAAGAAMAEEYCEELSQAIIVEERKKKRFCRPRFSPGYGDFSLLFQKDFSRILNMPGTIGVSLTDSLLMVPSKSITAVIGIAGTPLSCGVSGCDACTASGNCPYRKN